MIHEAAPNTSVDMRRFVKQVSRGRRDPRGALTMTTQSAMGRRPVATEPKFFLFGHRTSKSI